MSSIFRLFIVALTFTSPLALAMEISKTFSSGVTKVPLIELYTSEGCSSCPPADEWLGRLKSDERLWNEFVPIAFHVDYWDYIGWKDPFAKRSHALRQRQYRSEGNIKGVYTPGFIYMGQEFRAWYLHEKIPKVNWSEIGNLTVTIKAFQAHIKFTPVDNFIEPLPERLKINLSILGFDLTSKIKRGENEGKTLTHEFVSLDRFNAVGDYKDDSYQWNISIPKEYIRSKSKLGIGAWVSEVNRLQPIQSTGGWLN